MSGYRGVSVQDRRVAPTEPTGRPSRRAGSQPPPADPPPRSRRAKKPEGPDKMRILAWVSIGLTVVLTGGSLTGYAAFRSAFGDINQNDAAKDIVGERPKNLTGALNVLIVGSDTREGDNAKYGQQAARLGAAFGKRTDTILLLHISPNRDKAQIISFPRDSMVQIPECKNEQTKQLMPGRLDMINSAYNTGGIACTIDTIESLTQIRVDHHVEVDFAGFKNIVNALGGVEMCFSKPINDKNSKFHITAGTHKLNGEQALAYMRLRNYGLGSDLDRIKRQQKLLSKMVQQATSTNLLTDVPKLLSLVNAAAKSVSMDKDLAGDPQKIIDIATSAKSLTASGVKFITVPVEAFPADPNRVQWRQPDATTLFQQIAQDVEVTQPSASPTVTVKPQQVRIQVLNGTAKQGEAQKVADELTKWGFKVVGVGNAPPTATTTVLYSAKSPADADYAKLAAAKMSGTVNAGPKKVKPVNLKPYTPTPGVSAPEATASPGKVGPIVQVVIGEDYRGVRVPPVVSKAIEQNTVSADQKNICT
ncbi:LCP family protein [Thermoactinospora rubra]|uniref:LCP family protein n=1 Tax=Thermoactinospora rubra TaxID=1088767 RepID=UPI000A10CA1E|nr:LCP family protein [Thermoactinospora rubra]